MSLLYIERIPIMNLAKKICQIFQCIGGKGSMKKKVLTVLLASAMVASLASGCGNKASETTGTTTTESAGTKG